MVLFVLFQSLVAVNGCSADSKPRVSRMPARWSSCRAHAPALQPMFLLTGLAASFHILVGIYAAFSLAVAMLLSFRSHRDNIRENTPLLSPRAHDGRSRLYAVGQYLADSATVDSLRAATIYVIERNPHHTFPGAWTKPWAVRFSASCLLFAGILRFSRIPARRDFAAMAGFVTSFLCGTGAVLYGQLSLAQALLVPSSGRHHPLHRLFPRRVPAERSRYGRNEKR